MSFEKLLATSILAVIIVAPSRQCVAQSAQQNETKGVCSPIVPDNRGSITINCSGFSNRQYQILRGFLAQLSKEQAKDQDVLLSKLNEILEAIQRQEIASKARVIPDSDLEQISRAAWGTIPVANILVIAPAGDDEAEKFAKQIAGVFSRGGMNVKIGYRDLKRGPDDPDLLIIHNNMNSYCVNFLLLGSPFGRQVAVKYESIKPPSNLTDTAEIEKFEADPYVPLSIVVYPRKPI